MVSRSARALVAGCALVLGPLTAWTSCRAYDRTEYADLVQGGDALVDGLGPEVSGDACVPPNGTSDPCETIPRLLLPQVVDAHDDEFCGVPEHVFTPANGAAISGPPSPKLEAVAGLRVAWSERGLHVFVHVSKSPLVPAPASEPLYVYDAVELLAAGSSALTGRYGDGSDPGAIHVVIAPPASAGDPGRASLYQVDGPKIGELPSSQFATRLVSGGFDVEVALDWGTLGRTSAPASGAVVAFDFGLDLRLPTSDAGTTRFQSFLAVRDVETPGTTCITGHPAPFCDDRVWCTPTLQ